MDFYDLDLNDLVLDALDDMNFSETTPYRSTQFLPYSRGATYLASHRQEQARQLPICCQF